MTNSRTLHDILPADLIKVNALLQGVNQEELVEKAQAVTKRLTRKFSKDTAVAPAEIVQTTVVAMLKVLDGTGGHPGYIVLDRENRLNEPQANDLSGKLVETYFDLIND
jgi:hypothetical protein